MNKRIMARAKHTMILPDAAGNDVKILPNDRFPVFGTVIAVKGALVDLVKYENAFEIEVTGDAANEPLSIIVKHAIQVTEDIIIPKDTVLKMYNNIISYGEASFDLMRFSDKIGMYVEDEDPTPFEPMMFSMGEEGEEDEELLEVPEVPEVLEVPTDDEVLEVPEEEEGEEQ